MKNRSLLPASALILLSLTLSACGGGGTPPPVVVIPDTTPPSIVSVSPANGATGVAKDASITVTFSEAMNQASAQAAFQSADLGAAVISWNADSTVMTVKPNTALVYTAAGRSYAYSVSNTATDAKGNALSNPASNTFKTFRQLSSTLPIKAGTVGEIDNAQTTHNVSGSLVVGDLADNTARRGFVGFDLSSLPADLVPANIIGARVRMFVDSPIQGSPFAKLFVGCSGAFCLFQGKSVVLEHVSYANPIAGTTYGVNPLSGDTRGLTDETPCGGGVIICIFTGTSTGWNASDITPWLQDDLTNKAARNTTSSVRLRFPKDTNNDSLADNIRISNNLNKAQLIVTYLLP